MPKLLLGSILVGACIVAVGTPLYAHGGQYKGPSDVAAGGASSGGSNGPPTNPGGSAAPGPGSAAGGAAVGVGATGRGQQRGGSARKARTGGATYTQDTGINYGTWVYWWENNKDAFLNLKNRLVKTTNVSGSIGHLTGRGRKSDAAPSRRPSRSLVNTEVIPPLQRLIAQNDNRDILDSAIMALGRTAADDMAAPVMQTATKLLGHTELSVQSASALTLGVLGSDKSLQLLHDLMADTSAGRQATGGGAIHWLVRAFAAVSLGLVDDAASVASLTELIDRLPDSDRNIKVCAIVGLGLMQNAEKDRAAQYLLEKLDDRRLDAIIKSYIPTSLGKLGYLQAVPKLLAVFRDRDTDLFVRQSCAIGLGRLANVNQTDVVETLTDYIHEGRDEQTRYFSFMSLAKIGARDTAPQEHPEVHNQLVKLFTRQITKPDRKPNRSWAALAGAVYMRQNSERAYEVTERLADAYEKESDPSYKAAFAVALGLLDYKAMDETIFADFQESKDYDFKGYAAVALGLMNYTKAADALRGLCTNKAIPATFRLQIATGLGLMGDTQAMTVLIDTLDKAETLGVSTAVAKALGLIGDKSAIIPLRDIAADESKRDLTRAFACVALGIVGEKTDLPWNAAISADNNYRARVPAIDEILDIL